MLATGECFSNSNALMVYEVADCYKSVMTVEEIRLANLRFLILEKGTASALANAANTNPSYLSQILTRAPSRTGKPRDVGPELARKLEAACGKPVGWMDMPNGWPAELDPEMRRKVETGNIASRPRRVYVVDEDSPVGDDEVEVPRLTLKLSAGSGRLNWEIDEKGSPNRFRKSWCRRKGLKPEALVTVPVAGDSMAPTIPDGASVTINTAETALRNGKPHAIDYMGEFFIKRLFRQPDGSVMVRSDNPDKTRHPDWAIPPEHGDALRILGAPVAISADLD